MTSRLHRRAAIALVGSFGLIAPVAIQLDPAAGSSAPRPHRSPGSSGVRRLLVSPGRQWRLQRAALRHPCPLDQAENPRPHHDHGQGDARTCRRSTSTSTGSRSPASPSTDARQRSHAPARSCASYPSGRLPRDAVFTVRVRYFGKPRTYTDPDGAPDGWIRSSRRRNGRCRAGWRDDLVPQQQHASRQGPLRRHDLGRQRAHRCLERPLAVSKHRHPKRTVWHWRENDPMSSYLATMSIGEYDVVRGRTAARHPDHVVHRSRASAVMRLPARSGR